MTALGTILTAIVTPFDAEGKVDEDSFVALMRHLAENGSDGFVVAGTTGEASTLTDEEQLGLIDLAVKERPTLSSGSGARATIIAGAGTNDTREAVFLTERATELGADAVLSVTPYYNKPSRLGLRRHYEAVAKANNSEYGLMGYVFTQDLNRALPPSGPILNALGRIDPLPSVNGRADCLKPSHGLQRDTCKLLVRLTPCQVATDQIGVDLVLGLEALHEHRGGSRHVLRNPLDQH